MEPLRYIKPGRYENDDYVIIRTPQAFSGPEMIYWTVVYKLAGSMGSFDSFSEAREFVERRYEGE